jgi:hypothetical protein
MRTRFLCVALLVALVSFTACGDDDDDDATVANDSTSTTAGGDETDATLALAPDGVVVGDALTFGTARAEVVPAVIDALGESSEEGASEECPAGEMYSIRWSDDAEDLLLDFQDDRFVGWSIGASSELRTEAGIGIGSTRAELETEFGEVDIDESSTIGIEFLLPDSLAGLLDGEAPDSLITDLWAGTTCIFR